MVFEISNIVLINAYAPYCVCVRAYVHVCAYMVYARVCKHGICTCVQVCAEARGGHWSSLYHALCNSSETGSLKTIPSDPLSSPIPQSWCHRQGRGQTGFLGGS